MRYMLTFALLVLFFLVALIPSTALAAPGGPSPGSVPSWYEEDPPDFLCTFLNAVESVKIPLSIASISVIAVAKMASPLVPDVAQRYGRLFRDVAMGALLLVGATWIVGLVFPGASTGCASP